MKNPLTYIVLSIFLVLSMVAAQPNRIQLSQLAVTGASTGNVITYNGTAPVWQAPAGGGGDDVSVNGVAVTGANLNNTTPAASIGAAPISWQTSGSAPANISASLDHSEMFDPRRREPYIEAEFLSANASVSSEFLGIAISSGTNSTVPAAGTLSPNHPGVVLFRSSTTANSGWNYNTAVNLIRLAAGATYNLTAWLPASLTGTSIRLGFQDSTTAASTDGVYIDFAASSLAPTCIARNNSTQTQSVAIATLAVSTWYHFRVEVISAVLARCSIWSDAGALLGSQDVTTNIPTASGRETGVVTTATNSGTVATDLIAVDHISVSWSTALTRGK